MKLGAGMWMKESGKILATTIVLTDGEIAAGRPIEQSGAQGRESNRNWVGVALIGGRRECSGDEFLDHYTEAQKTSLGKLLFALH